MSPILGARGGLSASAYGFTSAVAAAGDYESIQTVSVTSGGGSASLSFTSIPSTYKHLQIRGIARNTSAGTASDYILLKLNSDTGSNYAFHWLYGTGSAAGATASVNRTNLPIGTCWETSALASSFSAVVCDILDYSNTNKFKTTRSLGGGDTNNVSYGEINMMSGLWRDTAAISQIDISSSDGNLAQYSSFALYGIK
jgi:hypothetical protein